MPELPEVETTARGLRTRLVGRGIESVSSVSLPATLSNIDPDALTWALVGRTFTGVGRRGKLVLLHLDDGAALTVHRRMTGNLLLRPATFDPEPHTRLCLGLDDGTQLRFVDPRKFGRVSYFGDGESLLAFLDRVAGPEPLEDMGAERLAALLSGRRGRLKSLLLDQRFLAGIGNLYADEILWQAKLHPERQASTLVNEEVERLAVAIGSVLSDAIERRGTSLNDYRDADGEPGDNQSFLEAYGRQGQPCRRCGTPIFKFWLGQRGTHLCPACQPPGHDQASTAPTQQPRRRAASGTAPRS